MTILLLAMIYRRNVNTEWIENYNNDYLSSSFHSAHSHGEVNQSGKMHENVFFVSYLHETKHESSCCQT